MRATPRFDSRAPAVAWPTVVAFAVLFAVGGSHATRAATFVSPFAVVAIESNSNIFMRPSSQPPFAANGITALGDTVKDYEAGFESELDFGLDRLTLDGEGTRDDYNRFSFLDHTDYDFGAGLDWRLGPVVDGKVSYRQSRYMAPFTDTLATVLLLDTERIAKATVRVRMSPLWRIDLTPGLHQIDTPLPGFPGFRLSETTGTAELDYLGFGRLTAGLEYLYEHGRYAGIVGATKYDQRDVGLTARYKVSGLSTFSANVGYTRRDSVANSVDSVRSPTRGGTIFAGYAGTIGTTSSVTGSLSYERQLTGKTSASLSLFRRVDSYTAGANPDVATGGSVGVIWKADPKFTVDLNYSLMREQIKGGLVAVNVANRSDRTQAARVEVRYAALSWLTIRPYFDWTRATSTFRLGNYSQTIVGIDVMSKLKW